MLSIYLIKYMHDKYEDNACKKHILIHESGVSQNDIGSCSVYG